MVNGQLALDRSLVADLAIDLQREASSSSSSREGEGGVGKDKRSCKICKKSILLHRMRTHVGKHILAKDIPSDVNICGWCGSAQCYQTKLQKTSKSHGKSFFKPVSKCDYHFQSKKPKKANRDNPCTNWVEECLVCKEQLWKYNMPAHFLEKHPQHEIYKIEEGELKLMIG